MVIMMIVSHDYSVSYLNIMIIIDDKYHDYDDYIYIWYKIMILSLNTYKLITVWCPSKIIIYNANDILLC
jgi:hypothetical protein